MKCVVFAVISSRVAVILCCVAVILAFVAVYLLEMMDIMDLFNGIKQFYYGGKQFISSCCGHFRLCYVGFIMLRSIVGCVPWDLQNI